MTNFLQPIGHTVLAMFEVTGRVVIFAGESLSGLLRRRSICASSAASSSMSAITRCRSWA